MNSDNPQDQRKDNLRFDYRLNQNNQFTYRYSRHNWIAIDAFRGTFPFARTDWERPNRTMNVNWTSTLTNNLVNELSYAYSKDQVFIDVYTESGLHKRSRTGINYPYIFPGKEIDDKIPTITIDTFTGDRRRAVPVLFGRADSRVVSNATTWVKGRHTIKGGRRGRVLGRGRLRPDQRQRDPGRHQQPERPVRVPQQLERAVRARHRRHGAGRLHQLRGDRRAGLHQVAGAGDRHLRAGLLEADEQAHGRGRHPLRDLAAVVLDDEQHRQLRAAVLRQGRARPSSIRRPVASSRARATTASSCRATASSARARTSSVASDPSGAGPVPRRAARLLRDALRPDRAAAGACRTGSTTRPSCGPAAASSTTASRSTTRRCSAATRPSSRWSPWPTAAWTIPAARRAPTDLPFGMQAQDLDFKLPTSYMWSAGVQREVPFGIVVDVAYVGRRGVYLQRERNINQLLPGTLQANPGVNIAALRPYKGYGALRCRRTRRTPSTNSLQLSAERRYSNGLKVSVAYTLGKSMDNGSDKRNVVWNTLRRQQLLGAVQLRPAPRAGRLLHLRPAVLARPDHAAAQPARRLADLRVHVHPVRDTRSRSPGPTTSPAWATAASGSRWISWAIRTPTPTGSSRPGATATSSSTRPRSRTRRRVTSAIRRATSCGTRAIQQWDIALFKNFSLARDAQAPVPRRDLQLPQPSRTWAG